MVNPDISAYNDSQTGEFKAICELLASEISSNLDKSESKIWHGAPVWFIDGNPLAGYWVRKDYVQLLFWSGQTFNEPGLKPEGTFKAAEARYKNTDEINLEDLKCWLKESVEIQWDYKNIVKNKGVLGRLK